VRAVLPSQQAPGACDRDISEQGSDHVGCGPVLDAFPDAQLMACDQQVVDEARGQTTPEVMAIWNSWFAGQFSQSPVVPALTSSQEFDLEGHPLLFRTIGGADGALATIVYGVPVVLAEKPTDMAGLPSREADQVRGRADRAARLAAPRRPLAAWSSVASTSCRRRARGQSQRLIRPLRQTQAHDRRVSSPRLNASATAAARSLTPSLA
jgi:hypothetical protein